MPCQQRGISDAAAAWSSTTHSSPHCSPPPCQWCPSWSATSVARRCSSAQQRSRLTSPTPKTSSSSAVTFATGVHWHFLPALGVNHLPHRCAAGARASTTPPSTSLLFVSLSPPCTAQFLLVTRCACSCCSGLSRGIHKLDVDGMQAICSRDVHAFQAYLKSTGNT